MQGREQSPDINEGARYSESGTLVVYTPGIPMPRRAVGLNGLLNGEWCLCPISPQIETAGVVLVCAPMGCWLVGYMASVPCARMPTQ